VEYEQMSAAPAGERTDSAPPAQAGSGPEERPSADRPGGERPDERSGAAAVWRWLTSNPLGRGVEGRQMRARRWRITSGIFLVYLAYSVTDLWQTSSPAMFALGLAVLVVFVWLYVWLLPLAALGGPERYRLTVLGGMLVIMAAYLPVFGRGGLQLVTYLSVAISMLTVPLIGIPLIALLAAAVTWVPEHIGSWDIHGPQWALSAPPVLVTVALFALRANVAHRMAKEQERLRIARDLHDLLGHALTSITMKAELASRLVERDPERAAAEMRQVADLGRQSLADVRATVAGYREVSLVTELAAAREVLSAAGIQAELPASVEDVPVGLRELFGWAVREGVTNAVRHSGANHVRVRLSPCSIEIVDDGIGAAGGFRVDADGRFDLVAADGVEPGSRGNGLTGLIERASAVGGRVRAGATLAACSRPGFRLLLEVPG
jgi:two-component system sensor histidine kinase DesK